MHKKRQKGEQRCKADNDQTDAEHVTAKVWIARHRQHLADVNGGGIGPLCPAGDMGIGPNRDKAGHQSGANQNHKASQPTGALDHKTGDDDDQKAGNRTKEIAGGVIFTAHTIGNIFLHPGEGGGVGNRFTERKASGNRSDKKRGHSRAKGGRHPRREQQKGSNDLAQAKKGDKGAFIAKTHHQRRNKEGERPSKGNEREQRSDLGFVQPQFVEKEDKDRAKKD